ncbi:hypothetical protein BH23CHL5_BH23CHL5_09080 [soil metagenome]
MLKRLSIGSFALLLAIVLASMSAFGTVSAQDAAECVSPGLPDGTPTPMEDVGDMDIGSPEAMGDMASPEAMDMGSPEAMDMEPMELPEPPVVPVGEPADEETAAAIDAALSNYAACLSEGWGTNDPALYIALETENFWMASTGSANPYDRVMFEMDSPFDSVELIGITDPMVHDDGRVSGDISAVAGNWLIKIRAMLTEVDGTWLYDEEYFLSPDTSAFESVSVNGLNITETTDEVTGEITYAFEFLGSPTIQQTEVLVFNVTNSGEELHEAIVAQLPEGADPLGLLDGSLGFEEFRFVGGVFDIFPGQTADLALVNLEPGTYTLLCFYPGPSGLPHAADGLIGEFEIVASAE